VPSQTISTALNGTEALGYFTANSPNALASYPNDFDIIGGKDADLFDRTEALPGRTGLRATAALMSQVTPILAHLLIPQSRPYSLIVVARDQFGNRSKPTAVTFTLEFGPPEAPAITTSNSQTPTPTTSLQRIANAIAAYLDPSRGDSYFSAYRRASRVPSQCGATDDDQSFLTGYGAAFDRFRKRISASNIEAFYSGVCAAWKQTLEQEEAARQQAESARDNAIAQNMEASAAFEVEKAGTNVIKYATLTVVGVALSAFLILSLFLAFLAMENHSKAIREAVQVLAERK